MKPRQEYSGFVNSASRSNQSHIAPLVQASKLELLSAIQQKKKKKKKAYGCSSLLARCSEYLVWARRSPALRLVSGLPYI